MLREPVPKRELGITLTDEEWMLITVAALLGLEDTAEQDQGATRAAIQELVDEVKTAGKARV